MDPSEIEFLSERERITIVPNFTEGKMFLLDGDVGPFKAGRPTEVREAVTPSCVVKS